MHDFSLNMIFSLSIWSYSNVTIIADENMYCFELT